MSERFSKVATPFHGYRHVDGWRALETVEETAKKTGKKLKRNFDEDAIDPDEEENERKENLKDFGSYDD